MTRPVGLDNAVSRITRIGFDEKNSGVLKADLEVLLTTDDGVNLLKQKNKYFQHVLESFTKLIFVEDADTAKWCFKHVDPVTDIFRTKLPKFKEGDWWKRFEREVTDRIPKLVPKILPSDGSWVEIWIFVANIIVSEPALSRGPLNTLLNVSEAAFRKGKESCEVLDQAWTCWTSLIDAFGRAPKILLPTRTLTLLLKPLLACHSASQLRLSTWAHLIEVKGLGAGDDTLKQLVDSLCTAMYRAPGEKAVGRHFPDKCAATLIRILAHQQVRQLCLPDIVNEFGACLKSQPSPDLVGGLSTALVEAINCCSDASTAYKLWTALVKQYETCEESPVTKEPSKIFTSINFNRFVDNGIVDAKSISEYMADANFRENTFVRSIELLPIGDDHQDEADSQKRKSKVTAVESAWTSYSEAYLSWWSHERLPEKNEEPKEGSADYKAALTLIVHPLRAPTWSPTTFKTWSLLCEVCQKRRLLPSMGRPIFEALDSQDFHWQKAIDVLNLLCSLDGEICKQSTTILDKLSPYVICMGVKNIMDLLVSLEAAVCYLETAPAIGRLLKSVNEKCAEFDQLNAHKVRTKVGKISRKLEQRSPAEREKSGSATRTPFRAQSNFLQRLAKAEEKNNTKSPFLTSMFPPGSEKVRATADVGAVDARPPQANETNHLVKESEDRDDSDSVHIVRPLVLPTSLKDNGPLSEENGLKESATTAEKENVNFLSAGASPHQLPSPGAKLKITNARELKSTDSPSPMRKPKAVAGQKVTPKKITPSKVSYFDDDATDCVMVPPKARATTPLTEHQMEMLSKRRTDIPALYQDLSQDTQVSTDPPPALVVSYPEPEIVPDTQPPAADPLLITPERPRGSFKSGSSKKLDFNNVQSTSPNEQKTTSDANSDKLVQLEGSADNISKSEQDWVASSQPDSVECVNSSQLPNGDCAESDEQRPRRRKKSGPIKYSPKVTRSRRSLMSATPEITLPTPKLNVTDSEEAAKLSVVDDVGVSEAKPVDSELISTMEAAEPKTSNYALNVCTPEGNRKRKIGDSKCANELSATKKAKLTDEESECSSAKKSTKKKKKLFKLRAGSNNLESWLVKTDRPATSDTNGHITQECVPLSDDLNNSEEIVPSTQELDSQSVDHEVPSSVLEIHPSPAKTSVKEDLAENPEQVPAIVAENESPKRACDEPVKENGESPDDVIELIISSPSKRHRRASSVMRDDKDVALNKNTGEGAEVIEKEELPKRAARQRSKMLSPLTQTKRSLQAPGGRSAKMLRLAASSSRQEDEAPGLVTPTRRRESIVPVTYGENWPMGQIEDWVAYTPVSPFAGSPYRSALKKTPLPGGPDDALGTPQRASNYSLTSPLTSSAKRKRVVFLDPPVTRGLIYERDTSFGAIHLADVPVGSPYPTWKGERDTAAQLAEVSVKETKLDVVFEAPSLSVVADVVSNEVRILIDPSLADSQPAPSNEKRLERLKTDLQLDDLFVDTFATVGQPAQSLLLDALEGGDMEKTVDGWKVSELRQICRFPRYFLSSVRNSKAEVLSDVLTAAELLPPHSPPRTMETTQAQTDSPLLYAAYVQATVPTRETASQARAKTRAMATSTEQISRTESSSQADFQLPTPEELLPLLKSLGHQQSLLYLSESLRLLSTQRDT